MPAAQPDGGLAGVVELDPLVVVVGHAVVVPVHVPGGGQELVDEDDVRCRRPRQPEGAGVGHVAVGLGGSGEGEVARRPGHGDGPALGRARNGGAGHDPIAVEELQGDRLAVGVADLHGEGESGSGRDNGSHPGISCPQRQGQVGVLGGEGASRPQSGQEIGLGQGGGHDAGAMGGVGTPVGRLRVAVVGRPHVPAGSQGLQVGFLKGPIESAAAVAHLQQGDLLSDGGVVGEIVEVAVGEGMVELAEGSLLSGQPGVELGQGVVGRVIAGDEALGFKSVNVPHRLVGPLEAAQGHECPLGGGRAGLGPQVGPLLRTEPVGVVGEGQEVEAVGAAHGVGVSRWAAAVGVGGMGVEAAEVGPHPAGEGRGRRRLGRGRRVRGGAGVGPVNGEINSHVVRVVQAHPLQGAGLRGRESARHPCGGVVAVAEGDGVQDLIGWAEEQDLVARVGEGPLARGPGVVGDHVRHGQGVGVVASRDDHLEVGRGAEAGLELGGVLGHHDQALRPDCRPIGEASHPLAATLLLLVAHLVADEGHSLIRGVAQLHELVPLGGGGSSVVEHLADEEGNDGDRCRRGSRGWTGLRSGGGRCRS